MLLQSTKRYPPHTPQNIPMYTRGDAFCQIVAYLLCYSISVANATTPMQGLGLDQDALPTRDLFVVCSLNTWEMSDYNKDSVPVMRSIMCSGAGPTATQVAVPGAT